MDAQTLKQTGLKVYTVFVSDPLKVTKIDVGFALSATSRDASTTIRLMQDSIKSIIDTYGTTNLQYSVMTFGDRPKILARFADKLSPKDLKKIIEESVMPGSGPPDLERALVEAKKLFDEAGARPDAKRFLIVFMDDKSINDKRVLIEVAEPFVPECWVMPVAVDKEVDIDELEAITPLKNTTVQVPKTKDPDEVAQEIIDKMKKSMYLFVCSFFLFVSLNFGNFSHGTNHQWSIENPRILLHMLPYSLANIQSLRIQCHRLFTYRHLSFIPLFPLKVCEVFIAV